MVDYNQPCSDSLNIIDSFSRIVAFKKDLVESGLVPSSTLYPSAGLHPLTPIAFYDVCTNSPSKWLSDAFTSTDVIGPYAIGKGLQENISIIDTIINAFTKSLTADTININDVVGSGFFSLLADSLVINDTIGSFSIGKYNLEFINISDIDTKSVSKYLYEVGELPSNTLYPSNDFYPEGGMNFNDAVAFGFFRWLSDAFSVEDTDGVNFGTGKGLSESIAVFDIILFNIYLYLEENTNILDEISKDIYKPFNDAFTIEDNVVKNITQLLSESMIVNDDIEIVLRTLVRATLRAIKSSGSSLRAI